VYCMHARAVSATLLPARPSAWEHYTNGYENCNHLGYTTLACRAGYLYKPSFYVKAFPLAVHCHVQMCSHSLQLYRPRPNYKVPFLG